MADLAHVVGNDLSISTAGDILLATGSTQTDQRVLRRLITPAGGYIWQLTYGAGLPAFVGEILSVADLQAVISEQMAMEQGVAPSPAPAVSVTANGVAGSTAIITYTDLATGAEQTLTL